MNFGKSVGVVVPTYNESQNIISLLERIKKVSPEIFVVIVDDSSSYENKKITNAIGKSKFSKSKSIEIVSRFSKEGRGSAVIVGFERLLKNPNIKYFIEMDADLSHDPGEIALLLDKVRKERVDVVIGSRYLKNSKIEKWPLKRVIPSKIINSFINIWLGINLSDYTNGFRLYNREAVKFLSKIKLREKGFVTLSETIFRLKNKNFNISEVPIKFTDRKKGKSSAGLREYKNSLIGILRIRLMPLQDKS